MNISQLIATEVIENIRPSSPVLSITEISPAVYEVEVSSLNLNNGDLVYFSNISELQKIYKVENTGIDTFEISSQYEKTTGWVAMPAGLVPTITVDAVVKNTLPYFLEGDYENLNQLMNEYIAGVQKYPCVLLENPLEEIGRQDATVPTNYHCRYKLVFAIGEPTDVSSQFEPELQIIISNAKTIAYQIIKQLVELEVGVIKTKTVNYSLLTVKHSKWFDFVFSGVALTCDVEIENLINVCESGN